MFRAATTFCEDISPVVYAYLRSLYTDHGAAGLVEFTDIALHEIEEDYRPGPPAPRPDSTDRQEIEQLAEQLLRDREEAWLRDNLQLTIVCETCGRYRHGRDWLKRKRGEDLGPTVFDTCPACSSGRNPR